MLNRVLSSSFATTALFLSQTLPVKPLEVNRPNTKADYSQKLEQQSTLSILNNVSSTLQKKLLLNSQEILEEKKERNEELDESSKIKEEELLVRSNWSSATLGQHYERKYGSDGDWLIYPKKGYTVRALRTRGPIKGQCLPKCSGLTGGGGKYFTLGVLDRQQYGAIIQVK